MGANLMHNPTAVTQNDQDALDLCLNMSGDCGNFHCDYSIFTCGSNPYTQVSLPVGSGKKCESSRTCWKSQHTKSQFSSCTFLTHIKSLCQWSFVCSDTRIKLADSFHTKN